MAQSIIKRIAELIGGLTNHIDHAVVYPLLRKPNLSSKLRSLKKLNIGCGTDIIPGWINIDKFNGMGHGSVNTKNGAIVLNFNMLDELPLSGCIDTIYSSHFIEHLSFQDAATFLKRCHKYMKKGGTIRLAFPDLELWINKYIQGDMNFFRKYKSLYLQGTGAETKGEIFIGQIHGWDHKWCYDYESMKHILSAAGFSGISRKKAFSSSIPDIRKIEPDREGRLMESCYVEAKK